MSFESNPIDLNRDRNRRILYWSFKIQAGEINMVMTYLISPLKRRGESVKEYVGINICILNIIAMLNDA